MPPSFQAACPELVEGSEASREISLALDERFLGSRTLPFDKLRAGAASVPRLCSGQARNDERRTRICRIRASSFRAERSGVEKSPWRLTRDSLAPGHCPSTSSGQAPPPSLGYARDRLGMTREGQGYAEYVHRHFERNEVESRNLPVLDERFLDSRTRSVLPLGMTNV